MLCGLIPDLLQFANAAESALPQPFAGRGSCTGSQGRGALAQGEQWDRTAAGCVGSAGLVDSFHHVESYLHLQQTCLHLCAFSYYRAVIFQIHTTFNFYFCPFQSHIASLSYQSCFARDQMHLSLNSGPMGFLVLFLWVGFGVGFFGFFLGLADFRPHLLNVYLPTCTF